MVIKPPYTDSKQNLGFAGVKLQFPDDKAILVVTELLSSYRLGIWSNELLNDEVERLELFKSN